MSILPGKISDFLKIGVAAAGRGDLPTVQAVLAQKPAWITRIGSHGRTMLWEAAYRGRLAMVDYLLDQGADIHACGCHFTPLLVEISPYCAARYKRHHAVADHLLTRGATTDIYTAAFLGDSDAVADYLDREPELATAEKAQHDSSQRMTVLHYAVSAGHLAIVAMLLARGADPRPYSGGLIRFAVWRDRADILKTLLDAGADPTHAEAPRSGIVNPEIIELLTARGVAVDVDHAEGGWPPLVFPVARRPRRQCPARVRPARRRGRRQRQELQGPDGIALRRQSGIRPNHHPAARPWGRSECQRRQGRNAAGDCVAFQGQRQGSACCCRRPAHRRWWRLRVRT